VLPVAVVVLEGATITVMDMAEAEVAVVATIVTRVQTHESCVMMEQVRVMAPATTAARWATGPVNPSPRQRREKPTQPRIMSHHYFWWWLVS
jgi:hypothetical protein